LAQLLSRLQVTEIAVLLEKHQIASRFHGDNIFGLDAMWALREALPVAHPESVLSLVTELVETAQTLRNSVTPKYTFDDRYEDFRKCMLLDGWRLEWGREVVRIEPIVEGVAAFQDDLTTELRKTGLPDLEDILHRIEQSATDFVAVPPDFNGCLTNARIAVETLCRDIAAIYHGKNGGEYNEALFGSIVTYLRLQGFLAKPEEAGLTGIYTLASQGAHRPMGFTEEEWTRLGRNMLISVAFYVVKKFNAPPAS